jgi:hypothetical protein
MTTFEYLRQSQAASCREDNNSGGGGTLRGAFDAAPANSLTVGAVGFGPAWNDEPTLRELYDVACASIVRLEQEAEEARATLATWEVERGILVRELERLREMVADERARDAACAEKCHDKAAADGGWANI